MNLNMGYLEGELYALKMYETLLDDYSKSDSPAALSPYPAENFTELHGLAFATTLYNLARYEPVKSAMTLLKDPELYADRFIHLIELNQIVLHAHRRLVSTSPIFKDIKDEISRVMVEARAIVKEKFKERDKKDG
jgi:hypothetical protein